MTGLGLLAGLPRGQHLRRRALPDRHRGAAGRHRVHRARPGLRAPGPGAKASGAGSGRLREVCQGTGKGVRA